MRVTFLLALAFALFAVPAAVAAQPAGIRQPPRDVAPPNRATGDAQYQLHGLVVTDAGEPIANARVTVSRGDGTHHQAVTTDASGAWRFDALRPGRYSVSGSKTGFISRSRRRALGEVDGSFELTGRAKPDALVLRLVRGAAIAGRVVDTSAEPLAHVMVRAVRRASVFGHPGLHDSGRPATTDDRGEFRLFELPAGDYLIEAKMATPQASARDTGGISPVTTYYPGTTRASDAQVVSVTQGSEASGLVIAMQAVRTLSVSGRVRARCATMQHAFLMLIAGSPAGFPERPTNAIAEQATADGRFSLQGALPGEYTLHVRAECADDTHEVGNFPLDVADQDVTNLDLAIAPPVPIKGRVLLDSPLPGKLRMDALKVTGYPGGSITFSLDSSETAVQADGTFTFATNAQQIALSVEPMPRGWYVKSVSARGAEADPDGLIVQGATDGVEIELSGRAGRITGTVAALDSSDEQEDATVLVFHEDRRRWGRFSPYTGILTPDPYGRFESGWLPPGSYLAVAALLGDVLLPDHDVFERLRAVATQVTVGESQTRTVSLHVADAR